MTESHLARVAQIPGWQQTRVLSCQRVYKPQEPAGVVGPHLLGLRQGQNLEHSSKVYCTTIVNCGLAGVADELFNGLFG